MKRDPEQKLWDDVRVCMTGRWHAQRHEDRYSTGIPDVSYGIGRKADGWIELKVIKRMPAFCDKPWDFSYDHFTADQRNWLDLRHKHGTGRVFLMCRFAEAGTVAWKWDRVRPLLGTQPLERIIRAANAQWWHSPIDPSELEQVLTSSRVIPPRFSI